MIEPRIFAGLLPDDWASMPFEPFREGVEICHLWRGGPDVAMLRYARGASVPRHRHAGLETILVLSGSQSDENGRYYAGSLAFNPAGSIHTVWSEDGCTVLIQWEKPVEFI
ncbi:cupin domain-containing protein [Puniceibacterium confluentis]|uniref:cupin domain-containing protein n=1 Tax=Puniceibacterium confluentis TaxID=1958944 RepID=UPI0011B5F8E3|nr:cupin domain-containing protein [Puniceibacterium confluentis]